MVLRRLVPALLLTLGVGGVWACTSEDDSAELTPVSDDDDSASGNAGGAGGAGGATDGVGGGFDPVGSGGSGGEENCLEETQEAELKGLDMLVVLDRSGSMGTKWDSSVQALTTFMLDPDSAGIHIGMNFYPIDIPDSGDTCTPSHYNPPQVPVVATMGTFALADLGIPAEAQGVITSMNAQNAFGPNTPTYGALYGTYEWALEHQDNNTDRKTIVVFASDGQPNSCPGTQNTTDEIAGIAQAAFNYNSVETYVIGLDGANFTQLNEIAKQGGTGQAFNLSMNINAFSDKMMEIREQALGCEYIIPEPEEGQPEFEPTKVNVQYAPGGSNPFDLPQASDLNDCGGAPGWYYDNPVTPSKVILCPASCAAVESDATAKISLKFGCPTKMN